MSYPFQLSGYDYGLRTITQGTPVGGWKELGRTTLGSAGDTISVGSLADKRYYMVLMDCLDTANMRPNLLLNGDTGSNYSMRTSSAGGADATQVSQAHAELGSNLTNQFLVQYLANIATKEKIGLSWNLAQSTAGAGTAPLRNETVFKHAQTTNPISTIAAWNDQTGSFDTGSEVVVLGWDEADIHTTNFWEELASVTAGGASTNLSSGTIAAKKYLWVQAYTESNSAHVSNMTFNNDTTTYAYRNSDDGGADATSTSDSHIEINQSVSTGVFTNMFIINKSANEKLVIGHSILIGTAGAAAAPSRREFMGKYDNTAAQITEIDIDSSSGNYTTASIIKVWGSD